jgi:hypothetical protein
LVDGALLFIGKRVFGPVKILNSAIPAAARGSDALQTITVYSEASEHGAPGKPGRHGRAGTPCLSLGIVPQDASPGLKGENGSAGKPGFDSETGGAGAVGAAAPEIKMFLGELGRGSTVEIGSVGGQGGSGGRGADGTAETAARVAMGVTEDLATPAIRPPQEQKVATAGTEGLAVWAERVDPAEWAAREVTSLFISRKRLLIQRSS